MRLTLGQLRRVIRESLDLFEDDKRYHGVHANRRNWSAQQGAEKHVDWGFIMGPVDQAIDSGRREMFAAAKQRDIDAVKQSFQKMKLAFERGLETVDLASRGGRSQDIDVSEF